MIKKALSLKPGDGSSPTASLGLLPEEPDRRGHQIPEGSGCHPAGRRGIADHLGDAYAKAGKPKDALEQYQKALKLKPDMKGLQEKIDRLEHGRREEVRQAPPLRFRN